jgi:hypothetical protein
LRDVAVFAAAFPGLDPGTVTPGRLLRLIDLAHYVIALKAGRVPEEYEGELQSAQMARQKAIQEAHPLVFPPQPTRRRRRGRNPHP